MKLRRELQINTNGNDGEDESKIKFKVYFTHSHKKAVHNKYIKI